jgi:hypothetical protein
LIGDRERREVGIQITGKARGTSRRTVWIHNILKKKNPWDGQIHGALKRKKTFQSGRHNSM